MDKTDNLISALAKSAEPVKTIDKPLRLFLKWLIYSAAYEIVLLLIFGLRPDLLEKSSSTLFISEMLLLAAIVVTSGLSAAYLSFPDLKQKSWIIALPVIPFIAFSGLLYYTWLHEPVIIQSPNQHGIECLLCVMLFSAFSAVRIMMFIKQYATTHYYLAGAIAMLASSSLGALVFGLCEPIDSVAHLVTWHYLPMLGFMALGLVFGKKFLRW